MLGKDIFKCVVKNTPLISIDFLVEKNDKFLLGKRINPPAKEYYFTIGGRIFKNETIKDAQRRILKEELGFEQDIFKLSFIGTFEHFYRDSIFGESISTHYVNLAYVLNINTELNNLPMTQHNEYIWLSRKEILYREDVHPYVKKFFTICEDFNSSKKDTYLVYS